MLTRRNGLIPLVATRTGGGFVMRSYHQQRPDVILMAVPSQILRPAGSVGDVLIADWHGLFKVTMFSPFARPCRRFSASASWLGHLTSGDVAYAQCASALVNT